MTLVKNNNVSFNSLFDEIFNSIPANWNKDANLAYANVPVNIHETNEGFHLELNAPGRNKEDFKVKLEKDLLTISYEQKENTTDANYKTIRREFQYKGFKRSFSLDDQIQVDGIQAKYENGILKLFLPRIEKVVNNPKEISIL